jgi:SAM-dependent methyltransferase
MWKTVYGKLQKKGPVHRHIQRICQKILQPLDYESVLDVGCGIGHNIPLLLNNKAIKYFSGVDISDEALNNARQDYPSFDFQCLDIEKEFLNKKHDLVFCSLVLEHVLDDENALRNLYAMTKKYLFVVSIQGDYKRYEKNEKLQGHVRNYSRGELVNKIEQVGFKIIRKIEWGFPFYSPIGRMIYNLNPQKGMGEFNFMARFIANVLYLVYSLNLFHRGDIIIILAKV